MARNKGGVISTSLEEMQPFLRQQNAADAVRLKMAQERQARIAAQFGELLADDRWTTFKNHVAALTQAWKAVEARYQAELLSKVLEPKDYVEAKVNLARAEGYLNCAKQIVELIEKPIDNKQDFKDNGAA